MFVDEPQTVSEVDKGTTPLVELNGDKVFKLYCIDTMEHSLNNPGTPYLCPILQLPPQCNTASPLTASPLIPPEYVFFLGIFDSLYHRAVLQYRRFFASPESGGIGEGG